MFGSELLCRWFFVKASLVGAPLVVWLWYIILVERTQPLVSHAEQQLTDPPPVEQPLVEQPRAEQPLAEPSPLEQLSSLLEGQADSQRKWRESLPIMRAQSLATSVMLNELAQTWPTDPIPQHKYADLAIAAPDKGWAEDVLDRLCQLLPEGARAEKGAFSGYLADVPPPSGFVSRYHMFLAGTSGAEAMEEVRGSLAEMDGIEVDHSAPLNLVVVYPRG